MREFLTLRLQIPPARQPPPSTSGVSSHDVGLSQRPLHCGAHGLDVDEGGRRGAGDGETGNEKVTSFPAYEFVAAPRDMQTWKQMRDSRTSTDIVARTEAD